jgi:hypothetical protein
MQGMMQRVRDVINGKVSEGMIGALTVAGYRSCLPAHEL